jgi:hypothetical protein
MFAAVPDTSKNLIRILNTSDGQPVGLLSAPAPFRATFSPDGQFLAAGRGWNGPGDVKIWETKPWKEITVLRGCTKCHLGPSFQSRRPVPCSRSRRLANGLGSFPQRSW